MNKLMMIAAVASTALMANGAALAAKKPVKSSGTAQTRALNQQQLAALGSGTGTMPGAMAPAPMAESAPAAAPADTMGSMAPSTTAPSGSEPMTPPADSTAPAPPPQQ